MLRTTEDRFWAKVDKADTCWLWTGSRDHKGYGYFADGAGRLARAHRFAYELLVGPIPEGLEIDHVKERGCRHRHCVNPAHLEPVTHHENLMRGDTLVARNARKTHCPQGHPYAVPNLVRLSGGRGCRECRRAASRRWKARQRTA